MDLFAGLGPAVIGEIPFMMAKFAVFDAISKVGPSSGPPPLARATSPSSFTHAVASFIRTSHATGLTPLLSSPLLLSQAIYSLFPLAEESVTISLAISLISGMTAGVAAAVVSHPFDTLTTKVGTSYHLHNLTYTRRATHHTRCLGTTCQHPFNSSSGIQVSCSSPLTAWPV